MKIPAATATVPSAKLEPTAPPSVKIRSAASAEGAEGETSAFASLLDTALSHRATNHSKSKTSASPAKALGDGEQHGGHERAPDELVPSATALLLAQGAAGSAPDRPTQPRDVVKVKASAEPESRVRSASTSALDPESEPSAAQLPRTGGHIAAAPLPASPLTLEALEGAPNDLKGREEGLGSALLAPASPKASAALEPHKRDHRKARGQGPLSVDPALATASALGAGTGALNAPLSTPSRLASGAPSAIDRAIGDASTRQLGQRLKPSILSVNEGAPKAKGARDESSAAPFASSESPRPSLVDAGVNALPATEVKAPARLGAELEPQPPAPLVANAPVQQDVEGAVLRNAAHLRVETGDAGALELHLRMRDGALHMRVDGDAAHVIEARAGELSRSLANDGLKLAPVEITPRESASAQSSADGGRQYQERRQAWDEAADAQARRPSSAPTPAPESPSGTARGVHVTV